MCEKLVQAYKKQNGTNINGKGGAQKYQTMYLMSPKILPCYCTSPKTMHVKQYYSSYFLTDHLIILYKVFFSITIKKHVYHPCLTILQLS